MQKAAAAPVLQKSFHLPHPRKQRSWTRRVKAEPKIVTTEVLTNENK